MTILSLDRTDELDRFIGTCLYEVGVWKSWRTSDGIDSIHVLEHGADRLRVRGQIWEIDQTLHTFWLELARDGVSDRFAWFLYYDVNESSPRRARNVLDSCGDPASIEWRATLAGEATVEGDALALVAGSARVLVRDAAGFVSTS